ncbi:SRPBCC family protein [Xinfangfangia sp. CPCC 101601]|uniref:SRPBCC family protein n=1 Tax=Pseudogemmobacter lacusdianii TaxID=3069608 RepID=A0ABU0W058_9RHOB|nr:SRPBCC family protein [Xinfangfangia sp. CPCC 101601]MDQ2066820.1 SRPBCC family protein [Xinfangfangia sp. CPCC 101601]
MKFTTRQDVEAPLQAVYDWLTDYEQFERMVMRRGAEIERTDRLSAPGPGMGWRLRFAYRGKPRKLLVRLIGADPSGAMQFELDSPSVAGEARIELLALSPRRTRLTIQSELRPKTLPARLFFQSLRLAKGRVQKKLDQSSGKLAGLIEQQHRAPASR